MIAFRFRLGEQILVVLYLGLIFAAVRAISPAMVNSPEFWSKVGLVTLAAAILGVLCTSIPAICTRKGPARAFWIGFASFGWAFFLMGYGYFLAGQFGGGLRMWPAATTGGLIRFQGDEPLWFTLLCTPLFAHVGGRIGQAFAVGGDERSGVSRSGR